MFRNLLRPLVIVLGALLSGCGGDALSQGELDAARNAVQTALEAWKKGEKPVALKDRSIEIFDPDWTAGVRLNDFTIQRAEGRQGANIRCWALLNLKNRQGKLVEKEIVYEVSGKDKLIIGRDPMN